ncbi:MULTISPECIES: DeoR/GlpR family DNA-binding transcription regulator [unclassified Enterococcus]|uniref:DeoR/GlpR family DNA-binding transcription regulator n=1 Tax=unclassified Enterococcus TaxID=2608891 RepID=UPI0015568EC3|nr:MULTISPECIES: DeoR/GlpR family DNA-binding transcription regulator [unclassified Enterococcus]MBS7577811.1 DeoR/GlpR transcriptional regulator [Enterococcus sp. MMGLQ5-2]MBS7585071.1 DeoR/GlpR transcriptional regulator [Enterococcus sp. MMGLQ5-1]NPD12927.1 DeoR/GlpR transcriptional regulator [Enterococcus sp. MMGLQ5-1]NPD37641.1 DeoR/GlpR transcriptional regulator [Enterococcus sp. MMGLQ5-2]
MKAEEIQARRQAITKLLYQKNEVRINELVNQFQVSDETIRKDLKYLASEGILEKRYGVAKLIQAKPLEPVVNRTPINYANKSKLVQAAAKLIPKGRCSIGLDQGSTAALLANHLKTHDNKHIFTGSLAAILELIHSKNTVYCVGGRYSEADMSFQNDTANQLYDDVKYDLCFLGSSGVLGRDGFCTSSLVDAEIKRQLIAKSTRTIILLDSQKFNYSSLVQVAKWQAADIVITNQDIPADARRLIEAKTRLILV